MLDMMVSVRNGMFKTQMLSRGEGETLVYLHGAGGQARWDPFLDRLSSEYRVYVPIHPGFGKSEGVELLDDVHDLTLYYLDLFDEMGWQDPIVVGHSFGGMVAAEIASVAPERVSRLVLVAPIGLWDDANPVADFFAMMPEELGAAIFHDPNSEIAKAMFTPPTEQAAMVDAMVENIKNLSTTGRFVWPIPDKGLKKRIHRISAPTLIIWGASDALVPPTYGNMFLDRITGSRLINIAEAGHLPQYEQEDTFIQAVMDFLED